MFRTPTVLTVIILTNVFLAISLSTPRASAQPTISWAFYQQPCDAAAQQADEWFRVGNLGFFYADDQPITGCNRASGISCTEPVRVYPFPGEAPLTMACDPLTTGCGKKFQHMADSWVLILDLLSWHAHMVDAVIRGTTDDQIDTQITIMEPGLPHLNGAITDYSVYRDLAALADAVDFDGTPRPSVINMSFGRLLESGDALNAACPQDSCYDGALSCQLANLLAYLTRESPGDGLPRTVAVSSAGNDALWLTPGRLQEVISTGILDSTALANGDIDPARETPPDPDALMPGNGLCVDLPIDRQNPDNPAPIWTETSLPAGSSNSTGIMSGLVSDLMHNDPDSFLDRLGQGAQWVPRRDCAIRGCPFVLTDGTTAFPSPSGEGSDFLYQTVYGDPAQCGMSSRVSRDGTLEPVNADLLGGYESLPELTAGTHRPTPEPNVCIPCVLDVTSPFQGPGSQKAALRQGAASNFKQPIWVELDIDTHGAWPLGSSNTLHGLYLRVGAEVRKIVLDKMKLLEIQMGHVDYLEVEGYFSTFDLSQQPSLLAVISREDPYGLPEYFLRSTPMFSRP